MSSVFSWASRASSRRAIARVPSSSDEEAGGPSGGAALPGASLAESASRQPLLPGLERRRGRPGSRGQPFGLARRLLLLLKDAARRSSALAACTEVVSERGSWGTACPVVPERVGRIGFAWTTFSADSACRRDSRVLGRLGRRQSHSWCSPSGNLAFVAMGRHLAPRPLTPQGHALQLPSVLGSCPGC